MAMAKTRADLKNCMLTVGFVWVGCFELDKRVIGVEVIERTWV